MISKEKQHSLISAFRADPGAVDNIIRDAGEQLYDVLKGTPFVTVESNYEWRVPAWLNTAISMCCRSTELGYLNFTATDGSLHHTMTTLYGVPCTLDPEAIELKLQVKK